MENHPTSKNRFQKHVKAAAKTFFAFFVIKGLLWLIVPALLMLFAVEC